MPSTSSSSRREDLRLGLESEVVDEFARVFRREMVDSFSSSSLSLSLLFDFETSEPALDRPELDRPKLNMMATFVPSGYIIVRLERVRRKMSRFLVPVIVVQGSIYVASLMLSLIDGFGFQAMSLHSLGSSRMYTGTRNERCEHELKMHEKGLQSDANHL